MNARIQSLLALHPFLFGVFPILSCFAANAYQFTVDAIVLPIIVVLLATVCFHAMLTLLLHNKHKAALIVSIFWLLFFAYGHLYGMLEGLYIKTAILEIGANKVLFTVSAAIILLSIAISFRLAKHHAAAEKILNVIAISLIITSTLSLLYSAYQSGRSNPPPAIGDNLSIEIKPKKISSPNIYYIILDGFARDDVLRDYYDYADTSFLAFLKANGFYIARKSRANYCQTILSLTSSLNYTYLDSLSRQIGIHCKDRKPLWRKLRANRAFSILRSYGYRTIAISSGYWLTEIKTADTYIRFGWFANEFNNALIATTMLQPLLNKFVRWDLYSLHQSRIRWIYSTIEKTSQRNGPFIVFAHIMSPHPPFAFNADGSSLKTNRPFSEWDGGYAVNEYRRLYKNQLIYIAKRTRQTIKALLATSQNKPIIILQSDHGPGSLLAHNDPSRTDMHERMSILNAYHIPDNSFEMYDSLSPVNSFKIILNQLFGLSYNLDADRSYFSTWDYPYMFINIDSMQAYSKAQ